MSCWILSGRVLLKAEALRIIIAHLKEKIQNRRCFWNSQHSNKLLKFPWRFKSSHYCPRTTDPHWCCSVLFTFLSFQQRTFGNYGGNMEGLQLQVWKERIVTWWMWDGWRHTVSGGSCQVTFCKPVYALSMSPTGPTVRYLFFAIIKFQFRPTVSTVALDLYWKGCLWFYKHTNKFLHPIIAKEAVVYVFKPWRH